MLDKTKADEIRKDTKARIDSLFSLIEVYARGYPGLMITEEKKTLCILAYFCEMVDLAEEKRAGTISGN